MKVELVTWIDSVISNGMWKSIDMIVDDVAVITSVGFIIKETDSYIVIAPHLGIDNRYMGWMIIQKSSIRMRRVVELAVE
jgi:hypothetical protein